MIKMIGLIFGDDMLLIKLYIFYFIKLVIFIISIPFITLNYIEYFLWSKLQKRNLSKRINTNEVVIFFFMIVFNISFQKFVSIDSIVTMNLYFIFSFIIVNIGIKHIYLLIIPFLIGIHAFNISFLTELITLFGIILTIQLIGWLIIYGILVNIKFVAKYFYKKGYLFNYKDKSINIIDRVDEELQDLFLKEGKYIRIYYSDIKFIKRFHKYFSEFFNDTYIYLLTSELLKYVNENNIHYSIYDEERISLIISIGNKKMLLFKYDKRYEMNFGDYISETYKTVNYFKHFYYIKWETELFKQKEILQSKEEMINK